MRCRPSSAGPSNPMYNLGSSCDLISVSPLPRRNSDIHYKDVSATIGVDGNRDAYRSLLHISTFHLHGYDRLMVLFRNSKGKILPLLIHEFVWRSWYDGHGEMTFIGG